MLKTAMVLLNISAKDWQLAAIPKNFNLGESRRIIFERVSGINIMKLVTILLETCTVGIRITNLRIMHNACPEFKW